MSEKLTLDELSKKLFERGETAASRLQQMGPGTGRLPDFANMEPEEVLAEWIGPAYSTARGLTNGSPHPDSDLIVVTLAALWLQIRGMAP